MSILMDSDQIHKSVLSFAADLYSQVLNESTKDAIKNQFLSPLSIYAALSLVLAGSANDTKTELLRVMHLASNADDKALHKAISHTLIGLMKSTNETTVSMGNGIFADHTTPIKESYKSMLTDFYKTIAENLDFQGNSEAARQHINKWVNDRVMGKIPQLLAANVVSRDTRMVLVNTLYFKGKWVNAFQKSATVDGDFFLLNGESKKVPLMFQEKSFGWLDLPDLDAQSLQLGFDRFEQRWKMVIVLPNKRDGLTGLLEQLLHRDRWSRLLKAQWAQERVRVWLPRFKLCSDDEWDTRKTLKALGLTTMFDPIRADFSGISDVEKLFTSDVKHKAVLEVDEEGAVAAAATASSMMLGACPRPVRAEPKQFRVDHPFLVLMVDEHGTPMFMGHVVEPEKL